MRPNIWYKTHLVDNDIIYQSDVVGASPVGAANLPPPPPKKKKKKQTNKQTMG